MRGTKGEANMKYFAHCTTLEELKKEYRRLAKIHHPDVGGDTETMKAINAEYDAAVESMAGNASHKDNQRAKQEDNAAFRAVIASLIKLDALVIELCGTWIWVTGETYRHKEALKAAGCRWAKNKGAWYWHSPEDACHNRKKLTLAEIRALHGSEIIAQTRPNNRLQTA